MNNKTTTKNQVIDYLQWSENEYEERLFLSILRWCQHYGAYPSIIQQLLANAQVNKWFLNEYNKAELQFLKITEVVPNNTEVLRGHYKACTAQVMAIYPAPLINDIKRNKEFSNSILDTVYYAN